MRGIKKILILFIASFMAMGLTGCSETVYTKEEAKTKLEYDKRVLEAVTKSAEEFPKASAENTFDEVLDKLKNDVNSLFKNSKESSNLKLKDELQKDLKFLDLAFTQLIQDTGDIQFYVAFLDLEAINDEQRLAIKHIYESSKIAIEKVLMQYIIDVEEGVQVKGSLNGLTMQCEKVMNAYLKLNQLYNLNSNDEYLNIYKEKIPGFKEEISKKFSLDNPELSFLDVNTQSEKELVWNEAKKVVEDLEKSGKLSFTTSIMSSDVVIKKSGSIYVIKSYVDVTNNGTTERKEFTVKLDINDSYTMFVSLDIK